MGKSAYDSVVKRVFDILVALSGIVVLFPVWCLVALLVAVTSPGPVFFVQKRPGYKRKLFNVYKFRTMRVGSEWMVKGVEVALSDNRITPIGRVLRRLKIDEIPQLLNVVKGDMSLIGPRPERLESLNEYDSEISKRLDVRPGMTGLAQVSGNIYIDLSDRYTYDVYYVENYTLRLDIRILVRTLGVVIFGEEKYAGKPVVSVIKEKVNLTSEINV